MSPRTILITGCSSGIGLALAHGLRERGHRVFATARREADVARLQAEGFDAFRLDLDDPATLRDALESMLAATGGRLDVLINNAAFGQPGAVEDLSREALRAQFETNLFGTHDLTARVLPIMRRQGSGRVIFISSVLGLAALPFRGAYSASKFALEGLADTLRLELHGSGIDVVLVEPGPVTSCFRANSMEKFRQNIDVERSPFREIYQGVLRRLAKPGPAAPFTLGPDAVLRKVIHAIEARRPKVRYYVTFPTYLFATLRRLLPYRVLDEVLRRVSRGENR